MKQIELITTIADKTGLTAERARWAVDALKEIATECLMAGEKVELYGFGIFSAAERAARPARIGRNPQTGERITVAARPSRMVAKFRPAKALDEAMNLPAPPRRKRA